MHERELERIRRDREAANDDHAVPGRANTSASLVRRAAPQASGILMRKGAGEATADAETAVTNASASSGHALPGELRDRFEGSLGVDLSSVRVHTGSQSQQAAQAVSARAYAQGNDIHFAAGQYDPSSAAGQHLIAHEVAHTVQQRGAPARQHKLEVSQAGDAHEVEADRAADAMLRGAPATVSSLGGGVVQRDPDRTNPLTGEPELPRPLHWDGIATDGDIAGPWAGAPQFSVIAVGGMSPAGLEFVNRVERAKLAFSAVWFQAQGTWNGAVVAMKDYKDAAQDAENKGLADFGGKGTDIDLDAEGEDFGGKTTVGDAFSGPNKVEAGNKTFDRTKVDSELKRTIIAQKQAKVVAARGVDESERGIDDAKTDLGNAKLSLENAILGVKAKEDAKDVAAANRQIEAMKRAKDFISTAIGGMAKMTQGKAGAAEAGEVGLQMINTFVWDSKIMEIEGQIAALEGASAQGELIGAENAANIARGELRKANNKVRTAIDNYKTKCGEWKKAHADLAASLEKAAVQSSGNPKLGEKVRAAVEAIPLIQLTVDKCQALSAKLTPPAENRDAIVGGGMCSNASDFSNHVAILTSWKGEMSIATAKWQQRLTLAKKLVDQAQ